jgi:hypothetical protein
MLVVHPFENQEVAMSFRIVNAAMLAMLTLTVAMPRSAHAAPILDQSLVPPSDDYFGAGLAFLFARRARFTSRTIQAAPRS